MRFACLLLSVLLFSGALCAEEKPAPETEPRPDEWTLERLRKIVADLGHEQFSVRDSASRDLDQAPPRFLPELVQAGKESADPEVRKRLHDAAQRAFTEHIVRELAEWKIGRGFLGISWSISEDPHGVLVQQVIPGTGAERAGVQANDIVVKIDQRQCDATFTYEEALKIWRQMAPGDPMKLVVMRAGAEVEIDATIGEVPAEYRNESTEEADKQKELDLWARYLQGELTIPEKLLRKAGGESAPRPLQSWPIPVHEQIEKKEGEGEGQEEEE